MAVYLKSTYEDCVSQEDAQSVVYELAKRTLPEASLKSTMSGHHLRSVELEFVC
jgi:hypothetical protein